MVKKIFDVHPIIMIGNTEFLKSFWHPEACLWRPLSWDGAYLHLTFGSLEFSCHFFLISHSVPVCLMVGLVPWLNVPSSWIVLILMCLIYAELIKDEDGSFWLGYQRTSFTWIQSKWKWWCGEGTWNCKLMPENRCPCGHELCSLVGCPLITAMPLVPRDARFLISPGAICGCKDVIHSAWALLAAKGLPWWLRQ